MNESNSFRDGSSYAARMKVNAFQVTAASFPASLKLAAHRHERAGCSIVLKGALEKDFCGKSFDSPANSIVTMPPGERHKARFARQGAHMLIIEPASPEEDMLRPCAGLFRCILNFRDVRVASTAWLIYRELLDPDEFSPLAVEGLILELLARAARRHEGQQDYSAPPPWLVKARAYLHEQFGSNVRIADLAATVGVHPVHMARMFRDHLGRSPGEYLRQLRLEWAAAQLSATQKTIGDIAQEAGFADQSHFTRVFKRHAGLTPGQYRASDWRPQGASHRSRT